MATNSQNKRELVGIMPTYRDLFPKYGAIGEKAIIKIISRLYRNDCLMILTKFCRHFYKYKNSSAVTDNGEFRAYCFELLDQATIDVITQKERQNRKYDIIFPELSAIYLIKLCLRYCDSSTCTKEEYFSKEILHSIGKCLLIANAKLFDFQTQNSAASEMSLDLVVNLTKQQIADKQYNIIQKIYQNYFIFIKHLSKYEAINIDDLFLKKYQVTARQYFAFLFLLLSHFFTKKTQEEDYSHPYLDKTALSNLLPIYKQQLLSNLVLPKNRYKKLDLAFYDIFEIIRFPFIEMETGVFLPISLRRLFLGITDGVYFDILNSLEEKEQGIFSTYFGHALEDYFKDLIFNIDSGALFEKFYGKPKKKTPDAIIIEDSAALFFECKKKQFHTLEFIKSGTKEMYIDRLKVFCRAPLEQLCKRIKDFRERQYVFEGLEPDVYIYPIIVSPIAMPMFSGAWDRFAFDDIVLPIYLSEDKRIAHPEFIDFMELECIEEYLRKNKDVKFSDLIKKKRESKEYPHANWMIFLSIEGILRQNERLLDLYIKEANDFKNILFK